MPGFSDIYRRLRRPYRVRWNDLGPPRLEAQSSQLTKSSYKYGSLVDRVTRIFLGMDEEVKEKVLQSYREKYGDGAYAYAKRTIAMWKGRQVEQVGQTVMRLLEVVPMYVDLATKFELARIMREETLSRIRQYKFTFDAATAEDLNAAADRLKEIIDVQVATELPPGVIEASAWLRKEDASYFQRMIEEAEKRLLYEQAKDFFRRAADLQKFRREVAIPIGINAVFELPTARFTLRIVQKKNTSMNEHTFGEEEDSLLAKWSTLELETRFKSGEVSYPEYVLRNMDQFFTKEEQSELHKIAAMHGLELERLLMEIQIKSRTSEADLQKLLTTLRTLQEKKITADVVSRHETPSGHIEISARSRKALGCLPMGVLLVTTLLLIVR
ncbi:MAG TPA: hypothetical protein VG944_16575 [Fimbriimonas sp.]|nr:hypothetical protein [Fimbriimonas sp.]